MRADSQDSRHRFRFIKQTDSNGRRWGRENKAENWMRLTHCQMSPRIMFINGVYSKWHCALMLTLSWLLMRSLWWPTWEISNTLNIHTLLCVWGTFNGLVKDFGVSSVRRCPELIWGRPERSLGGPMIFRCSQSPKLTGVWKCPISSACRGGVVPRKKESPSQAGCTGRSQAQTWALKASLEHSLSFPISLSLSSPVWPNSNFHRKERAWLSLKQDNTQDCLFTSPSWLKFMPTLAALSALGSSFPFLKRSEVLKRNCKLSLPYLRVRLLWMDGLRSCAGWVFIINLTYPRVIGEEKITIEELPQIVLW